MVDFTLNAQQFKKINEMIKCEYDYSIWNFKENGIDISIVDGANVSILKIHIPKTSMKYYDYDKEDSIKTVGIDSSELTSFIKRGLLTFGDLISITDDGFMSCGIVKKKITWDLDISGYRREPRIPELDMKSVMFTISLNSLISIFRICDDRLYFNYHMNNIYVTGYEEQPVIDIQKIIEIISIDDNEYNRKTIINTDIVFDMLKVLKSCTSCMDITFGQDYPVTYKCVDKWGTEYMIMQAPRIE